MLVFNSIYVRLKQQLILLYRKRSIYLLILYQIADLTFGYVIIFGEFWTMVFIYVNIVVDVEVVVVALFFLQHWILSLVASGVEVDAAY